MKKKTIALLLVMMMIFGISVGGTIAFLQDSKSVKNTFTVGNVTISLNEAKTNTAGQPVDANGKVVDLAKATRTTDENGNAYKLMPGGTYTKDPTITLGDTSEDAFVVAKVVVSEVDFGDKNPLWVNAGTEDAYLGLVGFVTGGKTSATALDVAEAKYQIGEEPEVTLTGWANDEYFITQEVKDGVATFTYYFTTAQEKSAEIVLFDQINIPNTWTNDQIAMFGKMEIEVSAYAVQAEGFDSVYEAYHTAF